MISGADVYYRPLAEEDSDRRVAFTAERDEVSETAVFVPLSYDIEDCRSVFETPLVEEQLLVHVTADPTTDGSFSPTTPRPCSSRKRTLVSGARSDRWSEL